MTNIAVSAKSIFLEAVELAGPEERRRYLDAHCGHDPKLREHVEALLCPHSASRDFLESPPDAVALAVHPATAAFDPVSAGSGVVIGHYKLLEQIGEGGMGLV